MPSRSLFFRWDFPGGRIGPADETGYNFGKLALALNDKFNFVSQKAEVNLVFGYFSSSWKNHAKVTEEYYKNALKAPLETGDFFSRRLRGSCIKSEVC